MHQNYRLVAGRKALADAEEMDGVSKPQERVPDNPYVPSADVHAEMGIHLADGDEYTDDEDEIMIMSTYPKTGNEQSASSTAKGGEAAAEEVEAAAEEVDEEYADEYEDDAPI